MLKIIISPAKKMRIFEDYSCRLSAPVFQEKAGQLHTALQNLSFEELKKLHVTGIDMESSCMMTLGRLMGVKTCVVTMTTVLENLKKVLEGQERTDAEDLLCRTALEGIYNYHMKYGKESL